MASHFVRCPPRGRVTAFGRPCGTDMAGISDIASDVATTGHASAGQAWRMVVPLIGVFALAFVIPFIGDDYWVLIATRAAIYWVLISGLNLVVGFAGQLAIGWVALLTLGAYTTSVLAAGNVSPPVPPFVALAIAGVVGAVFGVIVGRPHCGFARSTSRSRHSVSRPS
jgi:branched-chain amino acid transport system permease protein